MSCEHGECNRFDPSGTVCLLAGELIWEFFIECEKCGVANGENDKFCLSCRALMPSYGGPK